MNEQQIEWTMATLDTVKQNVEELRNSYYTALAALAIAREQRDKMEDKALRLQAACGSALEWFVTAPIVELLVVEGAMGKETPMKELREALDA